MGLAVLGAYPPPVQPSSFRPGSSAGGGARASSLKAEVAGKARRRSRCLRIFLITAGSSMLAITLAGFSRLCASLATPAFHRPGPLAKRRRTFRVLWIDQFVRHRSAFESSGKITGLFGAIDRRQKERSRRVDVNGER